MYFDIAIMNKTNMENNSESFQKHSLEELTSDITKASKASLDTSRLETSEIHEKKIRQNDTFGTHNWNTQFQTTSLQCLQWGYFEVNRRAATEVATQSAHKWKRKINQISLELKIESEKQCICMGSPQSTERVEYWRIKRNKLKNNDVDEPVVIMAGWWKSRGARGNIRSSAQPVLSPSVVILHILDQMTRNHSATQLNSVFLIHHFWGSMTCLLKMMDRNAESFV